MASTIIFGKRVVAPIVAGGLKGQMMRGNVLSETLRVISFTVNGTSYNAGQTAILTSVGNLQVSANGDYLFSPLPNFVGPAPAVLCTIEDDNGYAANRQLYLLVTPEQASLNPDLVTGNEDTTIIGNVIANDANVDSVVSYTVAGTVGSYAIGDSVTIPGYGVFTMQSSGDYSFVPAANWSGSGPTITYTANTGATSTLNITVVSVNDNPDAVADAIFTAIEDTTLNIPLATLLMNDLDVDGDSVTVQSVQAAVNGSVSMSSSNAVFVPTANYSGPAGFTYTVTDGHGGTDTASVTIDVLSVNDAPVAVADAATTAFDTPVTVNVMANDTDIDSSASQLTIGSLSYDIGRGTATVNQDKTITFAPTTGVSGVTPITYRITDQHGAYSEALLNVTVMAVANQAPSGTSSTLTISEDTPRSFTAADFNFSDADGHTFTAVRFDTLPGAGSLTISGVALTAGQVVPVGSLASLVFTPAANANGNGYTSFTFSVQDSSGSFDTAPNTFTINVTPVDDLSVMNPETRTIAEDTTATGNVLTNDSDVDNTLTIASFTVNGVTATAGQTTTIPGIGTMTIAANGNYTFTPVANWNGTVPTVTYTANTGSTSTLNIVVTPVNEAPIDASESATFANDAIHSVAAPGVLAGASDPDGGTPVVTDFTFGGVTTAAGGFYLQAGVGTLSIDPDGAWAFSPVSSYVGAATATYTISDGQGGTDTSTLTMNVTGTVVNNNPVANQDSVSTYVNTAVQINASALLVNDTDADGNTLTVTAVSNPVNGTAILSNGVVTFTPTTDFNGSASFDYTIISDGQGGTDVGTCSVTVSVLPTLASRTVYNGTLTAPWTSGTITSFTADGVAGVVNGITYLPSGRLLLSSNGNYIWTQEAGTHVGPRPTVTYVASGGSGSAQLASPVTTRTFVDDAITVPYGSAVKIYDANIQANDTGDIEVNGVKGMQGGIGYPWSKPGPAIRAAYVTNPGQHYGMYVWPGLDPVRTTDKFQVGFSDVATPTQYRTDDVTYSEVHVTRGPGVYAEGRQGECFFMGTTDMDVLLGANAPGGTVSIASYTQPTYGTVTQINSTTLRYTSTTPTPRGMDEFTYTLQATIGGTVYSRTAPVELNIKIATGKQYDTRIGLGIEPLGTGADGKSLTILEKRAEATAWWVKAAADGGSDSAAGTSYATALATPAAAIAKMVPGRGDWILLPSGFTHPEGLPGFTANVQMGYSVQYPSVITCYNPADPSQIRWGSCELFTNPTSGGNMPKMLVVERVWVNRSFTSTLGFLTNAKPAERNSMMVLYENVRFRFHPEGAVGFSGDYPVTDVIWRRCSFSEGRQIGAEASNMYIGYAEDFTIEDCVGWHGGWTHLRTDGTVQTRINAATEPDVSRKASYRTHNFYFDTRSKGIIFRRNVAADGSSHGLQARGGTLCEDSVFIDNPWNLLIGGGDQWFYWNPAGICAWVRRILIQGTCNIIDGVRAGGIAIEAMNTRRGAVVDDSIVVNQIATNLMASRLVTIGGAYEAPSHIQFKDTLAHGWGPAIANIPASVLATRAPTTQGANPYLAHCDFPVETGCRITTETAPTAGNYNTLPVGVVNANLNILDYIAAHYPEYTGDKAAFWMYACAHPDIPWAEDINRFFRVNFAKEISTNNTPTVANIIPDQTATDGTAFSYQFASNVFTDTDGDTLTYTASGMPAWMSFTTGTRTFSGTPNATGLSTITVRATDPDGAYAEDAFTVTVNAAVVPWYESSATKWAWDSIAQAAAEVDGDADSIIAPANYGNDLAITATPAGGPPVFSGGMIDLNSASYFSNTAMEADFPSSQPWGFALVTDRDDATADTLIVTMGMNSQYVWLVSDRVIAYTGTTQTFMLPGGLPAAGTKYVFSVFYEPGTPNGTLWIRINGADVGSISLTFTNTFTTIALGRIIASATAYGKNEVGSGIVQSAVGLTKANFGVAEAALKTLHGIA